MDDLARWLGTQLDEDERIARRGAELCGCHPPVPSWSFRDGDEPTDGRILVDGDPHPDMRRKISRKKWNGSYDGLFMAEHIAEHDPARVLREIDAKRKMLALHGRATLRAGGGAQYFDTTTVCRSCEPNLQFPEQSWPCSTLRLLASVYADRDGYREEWAP